MTSMRHGIVVGVTGPGENTTALRWAAEESAATHRDVTLVHAVDPGMLPRPSSAVTDRLLPVAGALLEDVLSEYTSITGAPVCAHQLRRGAPADVLTDLSREAGLVVLSHRHLPAVRRIVTSSTSIAVAAHGGCPVVVVPSDWSGDDGKGNRGRWITVGVHQDGGSPAVLEAAFEEAAARGAGLRLLHAWRADPQYDDIIVERIDPGWQERIERDVLEPAQPLTAKYPDVAVDVIVRHEWPADALAISSLTSTLLVLGRRAHPRALPRGIGSIARTTLRTSRCPVMVVPV